MKEIEDQDMLDERFARVVWAAHILANLSGTKSQQALPSIVQNSDIVLDDDDDNDDDEDRDEDEDFDSNKNVPLTEDSQELKRRFLDCVAELSSPEKGWDHVVATSLHESEDCVIVNVARNGGFSIKGSRTHITSNSHYLRLLENFMKGQGNLKNAPEFTPSFEEYTIRYHSERIQKEMEKLHKICRSKPNSGANSLLSCSSITKTMDNFLDLIHNERPRGGDKILKLVRMAYGLVKSLDAYDYIIRDFGEVGGNRIWRLIRFIARPISNIRLLEKVAKHLPHFQNLQVRAHMSPPPVILDHRLHISESDACARLNLPQNIKNMQRYSWSCKKSFVEKCSLPLGVHAEIQLLQYHLINASNASEQPTIDYFGCSKKSCLLCETIIRCSPLQVEMRGRHGKCYPRWGISQPVQPLLQSELAQLKQALTERISEVTATERKILFDPIRESTILSTIDSSHLEALQRNKMNISNQDQLNERLRSQLRLQTDPLSKRPTDDPSYSIQPIDPDECSICISRPGKTCKGCWSTKYCSTDCQASDWPSHKLLCKKYANLIQRPSSQHKLAIKFPQNKTQPCFIWVPCRKTYDDGYYEYCDFGPFLGEDNPIPSHRFVQKNLRRDRHLNHTIQIVSRDSFLKDGSKSTKSLYHALGWSGTVANHWRGNLVITRKIGLEIDPPCYRDISLSDYRHALDYFLSYDNRDVREPEEPIPQHLDPRGVFGVKVNCIGERVLHGADAFVCVRIPAIHPIRSDLNSYESVKSPISRLVGLPVKAMRATSADEWLHRPDWHQNTCPDSNSAACFLFTETDLASSWWGWAPMHWQGGLGNVLLVREDDKDLSVEDAKVLCLFSKRILQPMFEDALGGGRVQRTKKEVIDFITRENMEKFREQLRMQDIDEYSSIEGEEDKEKR